MKSSKITFINPKDIIYSPKMNQAMHKMRTEGNEVDDRVESMIVLRDQTKKPSV